MSKIAIIGLGYVGLPLATEFAKKFTVIGFDINKKRILELQSGIDITNEIDQNQLSEATNLNLTSNEKDLVGCEFYIVTVPTPVDKHNIPDLEPLKAASKLVGKYISKGSIVIYESTVYPGCTEEICIPIVEKTSSLKYKKDFHAGYSPERINPGDKVNTLTTIVKVTSGSDSTSADRVNTLYKSIITAGTFRASSICVAEAAKVIENTQRDINIALINELSRIFDKLKIDTTEVLAAAGSKWNFLNFKPGLVGGHCIGVDPYYLTHKALEVGYHPEVILSGRRINDGMGKYIAEKVIEKLIQKKINVSNASILIKGITFKENCPDIRNTKVVDIYKALINCGLSVDVEDPRASFEEVAHEYQISLEKETNKAYDCIILAVPHEDYIKQGSKILKEKLKRDGIFFDIKSAFTAKESDWRL
jgi:UDP-N-acetyl-D-galactosamine dehydrogenase